MWSGALPGGCRRLYFRHDAAGLPGAEAAQAALARHVPGARIREVVNRGAFRIHRRMADRFRVGRVLLAGDAAHVRSPSAGVGMNAGTQDSANLAWKLGLVVAGRAASSLLDTHEEEHHPAHLGDLVAGYLVVIVDVPPPGAAAVLADPTLGAHGRLGAAADTVLLVRPDGYVAFRGEPPDPAALEAYLGELFTGTR